MVYCRKGQGACTKRWRDKCETNQRDPGRKQIHSALPLHGGLPKPCVHFSIQHFTSDFEIAVAQVAHTPEHSKHTKHILAYAYIYGSFPKPGGMLLSGFARQDVHLVSRASLRYKTTGEKTNIPFQSFDIGEQDQHQSALAMPWHSNHWLDLVTCTFCRADPRRRAQTGLAFLPMTLHFRMLGHSQRACGLCHLFSLMIIFKRNYKSCLGHCLTRGQGFFSFFIKAPGTSLTTPPRLTPRYKTTRGGETI
jgi:hypothetical protein